MCVTVWNAVIPGRQSPSSSTPHLPPCPPFASFPFPQYPGFLLLFLCPFLSPHPDPFSQIGILGNVISAPAGSGAELQPKTYAMHFAAVRKPLLAMADLWFVLPETQLSLTTVWRICVANAVTWFIKKTRPSSYVIPCQTWPLCVKGCKHKYGRTPEIGERWGNAPFGRGVVYP